MKGCTGVALLLTCAKFDNEDEHKAMRDPHGETRLGGPNTQTLLTKAQDCSICSMSG